MWLTPNDKHIAERKSRAQLQIDFDYEDNDHVSLSEDVNENLFRMVQEALNNIVKHAQVDRAAISLQIKNAELLLKIVDKGIGFNMEQTVSNESHLGLVGIQERAGKMNASVDIISKPGQGTTINIKKELILDW